MLSTVKVWMKMILVRGCEDHVPLLNSDQRISLGIFYHFNWKSCIRAAELAGMMIGRSDKSMEKL